LAIDTISLEAWHAKQRTKRRVFVACAAVAVTATVLLWRADRPASTLTGRAAAHLVDVPAADVVRVRPISDGVPRDIRLIGVTVPAGWRDATRRWVRDTAQGLSVTCTVEATGASSDGAAAMPGHVYLADGRMLNELLIERGMARADRDDASSLRGWFLRVEGRARSRSVGMWAEATDQPQLSPRVSSGQ